MITNVALNLIISIVVVIPIQIPFINNAIFLGISDSNNIIFVNRTCHQCLCLSNSSYIALNCFPNNTCQFFRAFPITYKIQSMSQGRVYFLQQIFPNASKCLMSNTSYVLDKLQAATPVYASVSHPRCLVFDNHGYLVTISASSRRIVRLYSSNLTVVSNPASPIFSNTPRSIAYFNETYYVGFSNAILAVDSNNFTILHTIQSNSIFRARDMMFVNNGEIMIVTSSILNYLVFFERKSAGSKDYDYSGRLSVEYQNPYGLWYIKDTYFYATSLTSSSIYAYSSVNSSLLWMEVLFVDARAVVASFFGYHLTIDQCNRIWFSLGSSGIRIFDSNGLLIGNVTELTSVVVDLAITDDYVIYISDAGLNRIVRIDLNT